MKTFQNFLPTIIFIAFFGQSYSQNYINIFKTDNSIKSGTISSVETITFNGDCTQLILTFSGGSTTETISQISEITFTESAVEGADPLPVALISFNASVLEEGILLKWETASEVNNYGFEIERSVQNIGSGIQNWEVLGFVEGNGNSNSTKQYTYMDADPPINSLQYRLKQIDTDGNFELFNLMVQVDSKYLTDLIDESGPAIFELFQNYPNPFNPTTTISYSIPLNEIGQTRFLHVQLIIYDIIGSKVATLVDKQQGSGKYEVDFNCTNLPSGIYIYKINCGEFVSNKKLLHIK